MEDNEIGVLDMVNYYLKEHKLDGLINEENMCECFVDSLFPCENIRNLHYCAAACKTLPPYKHSTYTMIPIQQPVFMKKRD